MAQKKISQKVLETGSSEAGHNRRLSPFDRNDQLEWGNLKKKLDPVEMLASTWLTEAAVLKRYGHNDMAEMIEKHAKELQKAVSSMK